MRLAPLSPTSPTAANLERFSRRLGLRDLLVAELRDKVAVLGDGTPDDLVLAVLAHRLDGRDVLGVVKPEYTGPSSVKAVKAIYSVPQFRRVSRFLLTIDQEDLDLPEVRSRVEWELRAVGMATSDQGEEEGGRLLRYSCEFTGAALELIVVISGLDGVPYPKHTVEDHLLMAAERLLGEESVPSGVRDPKRAWAILRERHDEIFARLLGANRDLLRELFPQHIRALEILHAANSGEDDVSR